MASVLTGRSDAEVAQNIRPARRTGITRRIVAALVPAAVCGLLLVPHVFRGLGPGQGFGAPWVFSGDEPHYLILVNSLLLDGDLDVANNYESVHRGGLDAGRRWAQIRCLDNHSSFLRDGKQVLWHTVYDCKAQPGAWTTDATGQVHPPRLPGAREAPPGTPEYSMHQPGIAILLAPVLYPFRGTRYLESVAVLCSGLATIGAFFFFRFLLAGCGTPPFVLNFVSGLAFLGTPVWLYGRSFFMESFVTFFVCGAYALALRKNWPLLPGVLLALAVHLKAYTAALALPLAVDFVLRRQYRKGLWFALPVGVGVLGVLAMNKVYHGGWLTGPQPFLLGSIRAGALGLLFAPKWGLFFFAPAAIVALWCWPRFLRTQPRVAVLLAAAFLLNYLTLANWEWWCGKAYGPRYLAPLLPFLFAALATPGPRPFECPPLGKGLVYALCLISVVMNGYAAIAYTRCWQRNPLLDLAAYWQTISD
jgi:hypothetical protein